MTFVDYEIYIKKKKGETVYPFKDTYQTGISS